MRIATHLLSAFWSLPAFLAPPSTQVMLLPDEHKWLLITGHMKTKAKLAQEAIAAGLTEREAEEVRRHQPLHTSLPTTA